MHKLSTAQIGRSGEILVQYRLLKHGIESAPMTTDSGIDLVVYAPAAKQAMTVQVKTNQQAKPAGGKGSLALDWWLREDSPAELVALVDLENDRVWLFRHDELMLKAKQHEGGIMHFYMYTDLAYTAKNAGTHISEFHSFDIETRIEGLFGVGTPEISN